ncbi:hypothetical protein N0V84_010512 [Fusarium piperis]|uniref:FAD/NAD(P)-binding domain-containing protein n=1 Tax=Fusarium piperis TaxID=1435070 RepID=A0A9W8TFZ4_9HYPO|nr:hypothetical protein N0V84_010512 [Fusarium piperis]
MESVDLVIIGAGVFGLAMARTYAAANPNAKIVVLESASSLGGTWASHRLYPGLKTNNILGTYEWPDYPMNPMDFEVTPYNHIPGTSLHDYLVRSADHFDIARLIRFNTEVQVIEKGSQDDWVLTVKNDSRPSPEQIKAKKLVLAVGLTGNRNMPDLPGAEAFGNPIFHAKDFLQHESLLKTSKSVVVYGGAKSAYDAVYAYNTAGIHVDWVIRESGRGPCWMVSPFVTPVHAWLEKLVYMRLLTWLVPCLWARDGFEAIRNFIHATFIGQWIVRAFFGVLTKDILGAARFDEHPETAKLKPWSDLFWAGTSVSILNYPTDFYDNVRQGKVHIHHADITHLSPGRVHLSTGDSIEAEALHCSTGWKHEAPVKLSPPSLAVELGLPYTAAVEDAALEKRAEKAELEVVERFPMLKEQPNLHPKRKSKPNINPDATPATTPYRLYNFIVPPKYIAKRNFAVAGCLLSLGQTVSAEIQAIWITALFDGNNLALPNSEEEAETSTDRLVAYQRLRHPAGCGSKHGDMIFENLPYWDTLLQDLDLPHMRKGSWAEEFMTPYSVSDYKGLIQQFLDKRSK